MSQLYCQSRKRRLRSFTLTIATVTYKPCDQSIKCHPMQTEHYGISTSMLKKHLSECLKHSNNTCQLQLSDRRFILNCKTIPWGNKRGFLQSMCSCTYIAGLVDICDSVMSSCNVYISLTETQVFPGDNETMTSSLSADTCFLRKPLPPSCLLNL